MTMTKCDDYFGLCPDCRNAADGYYNVGRHHWFFCDACRTKWLFGANIFSSWRFETEEEQCAAYEKHGYGGFREVECLPSPTWTRADSENDPGGREPGDDANPLPF